MIHHFATVDSTNTLAVQMAAQGAGHGTVIHADQQSGGRGRGGREFLSPVGGLYFSLILKPRLDIHDLSLITLAAGVGLSNGIRQATGVHVQLKWPNDLYSNDRKLGGVLTESGPVKYGAVPEFLVIGAGVNVNTNPDMFPSSLRRKVISLYHHAAVSPVDVDTLLKSFVSAMLDAVQSLAANREGLLAEWRALDYLQGRMLEYDGHDGMVPAIGVGLAADGQYIIRDNNGVEYSILAGDLNPIKLTS